MKVVFLPAASNPYQYLLAEALGKLGIEVVHRSQIPSAFWLIRNRKRVHALHLHWLHTFYIFGRLKLLDFIRFGGRLLLARLLGYKLIWTMHNIMPHENSFSVYHLLARHVMMVLANRIIVHCEYARNELTTRFFRKSGVCVIPLGNYAVAYQNSISPEKARELLHINHDTFVYLSFGRIHQYKGLNELIGAFNRLKEKDTILVICGKCQSQEYEFELSGLVRENDRIRFFPGYIPDDKIQEFFAAADVVVAPFTKILTSSSVALSLSFGRPVIAPALGCLPELITPKAGIVYNPSENNALLASLLKIMETDIKEMGQEAYRLSRSVDMNWDTIAAKTRMVYLNCIRK